MKKLFFALVLIIAFSCKEANIDERQNVMAKLEAFEATEAKNERLKKWAHDYITAVNSPNWRTEVRSYLPEGQATDSFIKEHTIFRNSFANYISTIKHVMVEENNIMVWMNISSNYAETFSLENGSDNYGDTIFSGIEAKNQPLTWDETWYFNVIDGKFGGEWDFLKDNHTILKGLDTSNK